MRSFDRKDPVLGLSLQQHRKLAEEGRQDLKKEQFQRAADNPVDSKMEGKPFHRTAVDTDSSAVELDTVGYCSVDTVHQTTSRAVRSGRFTGAKSVKQNLTKYVQLQERNAILDVRYFARCCSSSF